MATLYQPPTQDAVQYTLDSAYVIGNTSLTLNSTLTGIIQSPGICVIDRVDSSGNATATKREYFSFTGVSGTQLTGISGGLAGSTNQGHSVGAIVEFIFDVIQSQAIYDVITTEHNSSGKHTAISASSASIQTITTPQLLVPSLASISSEYISGFLNASGASLVGVSKIVPTWVFSGPVSGASAQLGFPVDMPIPGTIKFISAILRVGSSNASLFLDITKNGATFLNANGSQSVLMIPINGTFSSTASIANPAFVAGDVFNFSVMNNGSMGNDLTIKFFAR